MPTLTLIIKEHFLAQIVQGKKKKETRDIRPENATKYIVEKPGNKVEPRPYDRIQFYAGYNTDRKAATVEIKAAEIVVLTDETGEPLAFDHAGEEYVQAVIEYKLGRVLVHNY